MRGDRRPPLAREDRDRGRLDVGLLERDLCIGHVLHEPVAGQVQQHVGSLEGVAAAAAFATASTRSTRSAKASLVSARTLNSALV